VGGSEDTLLALDLSTAKPVSVGGALKKLARKPFLFLDANRILAMAPDKVEEEASSPFRMGSGWHAFRLPAENSSAPKTQTM